jgi:hypothetical protein
MIVDYEYQSHWSAVLLAPPPRLTARIDWVSKVIDDYPQKSTAAFHSMATAKNNK